MAATDGRNASKKDAAHDPEGVLRPLKPPSPPRIHTKSMYERDYTRFSRQKQCDLRDEHPISLQYQCYVS